MRLRPYQERIASAAVSGNTLVVLPTGAGKTFIAATVIDRICGPFDPSGPGMMPCALFLVPTRLLVEQQASALRRALPDPVVVEFTGGMSLPHKFDVLVSTPKAFQVAQKRQEIEGGPGCRLDWAVWNVLVFDEVHHVLKEHPYRRLALSLRDSGLTINQGPRVIGLTASYTYAVGETAVRKSLQNMCEELRIQKLETADQSELEQSGYYAKAAAPEIISTAPENGESLIPAGVMPESERKPHIMIHCFFDRAVKRKCTPFTMRVLGCIRAMEADLKLVIPRYESPIRRGNSLKAWGPYPWKMRRRDGRLGTIAMWYEALRLLVASWEEAEDAVTEFLRMSECDNVFDGKWSQTTNKALATFWGKVPVSFPRFRRLKAVLLAKQAAVEDFRGILFVQQRVMTHILKHIILSDADMNVLFRPACVYTASTAATVNLSVSRSDAAHRLSKFASGNVNLLIATVVAEEGMDIPAANCVIRFDSMLHAVSLVQGRGRARQENSTLVVLSERTDRPVSLLQAVEEQQLDLMRSFQPDSMDEAAAARALAEKRNAQESREKGAMLVLKKPKSATELVHLFAKKTKVDLEFDMRKDNEGLWCCVASYSSVLRRHTAKGAAVGKKAAKRLALDDMLGQLRAAFDVTHG